MRAEGFNFRSVTMGSSFSAGTPVKLFEGVAALAGFPPGRNYDVSADGRFLMVKDLFVDKNGRPAELTVVLNWSEELKTRVPNVR